MQTARYTGVNVLKVTEACGMYCMLDPINGNIVSCAIVERNHFRETIDTVPTMEKLNTRTNHHFTAGLYIITQLTVLRYGNYFNRLELTFRLRTRLLLVTKLPTFNWDTDLAPFCFDQKPVSLIFW